MKKITGGILLLLGVVGLCLGVAGIFKAISLGSSPWIFAILGVVFFGAGISMLNSIKTIDNIDSN